MDEECYIIVKFNNKYCQCLSTKARVPCKIVFEVVKVKDLKNWDKYYSSEHYISREGRLSNLNSNEYLLLENNNEEKESETRNNNK